MAIRVDVEHAAEQLYRAARVPHDEHVEVARMDGSARRRLERVVIAALADPSEPAAVTDVVESILAGAVAASGGERRHDDALAAVRAHGVGKAPTGLRAFIQHAATPSVWGDAYAAAVLPDETGALFRILVQVEQAPPGARGRDDRAGRAPHVRIDPAFGLGAAHDKALGAVAQQAVAAALAYLRDQAPGRPIDGLERTSGVWVFRGGLPWPFVPGGHVPTAFHYDREKERQNGASMGLAIALATVHAFMPQWTTLEGPVGAATGEVPTGGTVEQIGLLNTKARAAEEGRVPLLYPRAGLTGASPIGYRQKAVENLEEAVVEAFNVAGDDVDAFLTLGAKSPVYGRDEARRTLHAAWERAQGGDGRLVVVSGRSGVGKSALVAEFAGALIRQHVPVFFESGLMNATLMSRIVQRLVAGHDIDDLRTDARGHGPWLSRFVPELARAFPAYYTPPTDLPTAADSLLHRKAVAAKLLRRGAEETRGLVVVLDDVQAGSDLTWAILETTFEAVKNGFPILVLATYRDEPRVRKADEALDRLRSLGVVDDVPLGGLDVAAVLTLVAETGPRALAADSTLVARAADALWYETGGNPLQVHTRLRELAQHPAGISAFLATLDTIRRRNEEQKRASFRERLRRHPAFDVLGLAAVLGPGPFIVPVINECVQRPDAMVRLTPNQVIAQLDSAAQDRLVAEVAGGRYAFAHESIRADVLAALPRGLRAEHHLRIAETLEHRARARDAELPYEELAIHYSEAAPFGTAETSTKAVEYATIAAERKTAETEYKRAMELRLMALEAFDAAALDVPGERARLNLEVARAHSYVGGLEPDARRNFREAFDGAVAHALWDLAFEAAVGFAGPPEDKGRTDDDLMAVLHRTAEIPLGEDDPRRVWLNGRLTFERALTARRDGNRVGVGVGVGDGVGVGVALEGGGHDVAEAEASGNEMRLVWALMAALIGNWRYGEPTASRLALADRAWAVASACEEKDIAAWAQGFRTIHLLEMGHRDEAAQAVDTMEAIAKEVHHGYARWGAAALRPMFAYLDGNFAESRRLAAEAAKLRFSSTTTVYDIIQTMLALREEGEAKPVEDLLRQVREELIPPGTFRPAEGRVLDAAAATLACDLGDVASARARLAAVTPDEFLDAPDAWVLTTTISLLAETSAFLGDARLAPVLYDMLKVRAGETVVIALGIACLGSTDRFLGMLAGLCGEWDRADEHFAAALAMNQGRLRAPALTAHTLIDEATMLGRRARAGDVARAHARCRKAVAIAESGPPMPLVERRAEALFRRLRSG